MEMGLNMNINLIFTTDLYSNGNGRWLKLYEHNLIIYYVL